MLYQFAETLLPGGHINNICLLAYILVGFSLSSVLQTCFQNPLANLTLTLFDNSPEAPSDSMTGVSYSPFFIPKVVSSPMSHSAFQLHEYQTLLFVQSQLYNAISKLFPKGHQTVLPS